MTDTLADPVATAIDLVRNARGVAREAARRHPDSTWIDAYTAIDRVEAQLGNLAAPPPSASALTPAAAAGRHGMDCLELLQAASDALDGIEAGARPPGLVLARAYLTEAIVEATGRQS